MKDLSGKKYGNLLIIRLSHIKPSGLRHWWVRCDCGTEKSVYESSFTGGSVYSCGCQNRKIAGDRLRTHGMSYTKIFKLWGAMLERCSNPNNKNYKNYGARGISVCERWEKFENFFADMGERPAGRTLDRKDNDGDYTPDNCRWATHKEQGANKRKTLFITYHGVKLASSIWADLCKLPNGAIHCRINSGWNLFDVFNTPLRKKVNIPAGSGTYQCRYCDMTSNYERAVQRHEKEFCKSREGL